MASRTTRFCLLAGALLILALFVGGPAYAQRWDEPGEPQQPPPQQEPRVIQCQSQLAVHADGACDVSVVFVFDAEAYEMMKENYPVPELFCREFANKRQSADVSQLNAAYDDANNAVLLQLQARGFFRNRGTHWESEEADEGTTLVEQTDSSISLRCQDEVAPNVYLVEIQTLTFPEGVSGIEWEADMKILTFKMPTPPMEGEVSNLRMKIYSKDRIMSAIYKLFGNPEFQDLWVAKAIFSNAGDAPIRDLRVRFKLSDYVDGWSEDKLNELVVPGQTVVETYYPILDRSCAELTSGTPLKLTMEYRYKTHTGEEKSYTKTRRILMLGANELVFGDRDESELAHWQNNENSPALWKDLFNNGQYAAAWVSSADPVVIEFGGMANELARGAGAAVDDKSAGLVARCIYDLMLYNKVTYQSPPGLFDRSLVQHVKYPRDVIRNKSGTCIDLAITFASVAEALGMDPFLILIPGHCFPGFILPQSGAPVAVEMTLLGGGTAEASRPFETAVQAGCKELQDAVKDGRYLEIHIKSLRKKGMLNPELPKLPADILKEWGIKKPAAGEGPVVTGPGTGTGTGPGAQANYYQHPNGLFAIPQPAGFTPTQADEWTTYFSGMNQAGVTVAMAMVVVCPISIQGQQYALQDIVNTALQTFQQAMGAMSLEPGNEPQQVGFCGQQGQLDGLQAAFMDGTDAIGFYCYTQKGQYYYIYTGAAMRDSFASYETIFTTQAEGMQVP